MTFLKLPGLVRWSISALCGGVSMSGVHGSRIANLLGGGSRVEKGPWIMKSRRRSFVDAALC